MFGRAFSNRWYHCKASSCKWNDARTTLLFAAVCWYWKSFSTLYIHLIESSPLKCGKSIQEKWVCTLPPAPELLGWLTEFPSASLTHSFLIWAMESTNASMLLRIPTNSSWWESNCHLMPCCLPPRQPSNPQQMWNGWMSWQLWYQMLWLGLISNWIGSCLVIFKMTGLLKKKIEREIGIIILCRFIHCLLR